MEDALINSHQELARFFLDAFKPPDQWLIGMEFEKLGVDPKTGRAISFSGPEGVEALLKKLAEKYDWSLQYEGERVIGLARGEDIISLEPGAQFELSAGPVESIHDLYRQITGHIRELHGVTDPEKTAWLGFGCHPVSTWEEIELIPKRRYDIMNRYLPTRGKLSVAMMREIAALQLNLDYESEQDAMEKFRLAMGLSPLITALFANSCISGGRSNGYLTRRAYIWQHTDSERCGFIEKLYHEDAGFEDYIAYALDVPMFFVIRDGQFVEISGAVTFREFMASGYRECRAT